MCIVVSNFSLRIACTIMCSKSKAAFWKLLCAILVRVLQLLKNCNYDIFATFKEYAKAHATPVYTFSSPPDTLDTKSISRPSSKSCCWLRA
jgi:hypothetical protein